MMVRNGVICAMAVFAPALAMAADPALPAGTDWSGIFVGGSVGVYGANSNARRGDATDGVDNSGFIAGVQGGYRHQFANAFVLGVELFAPVASASGSFARTFAAPPPNTASYRGRVEWAVDTSATLGYAVGDFLPFVTAGFVVAGGKVDSNFLGATGTRKQTHTGFSLGAGLEYALDDNWSVRGQYKFTRVSREDYAILPGVVGNVGMDTHLGLFGINYRF